MSLNQKPEVVVGKGLGPFIVKTGKRDGLKVSPDESLHELGGWPGQRFY